ncbi:MAG: pentapeptide repeat-containing protein [Verrucomicrobiota bacterium]
MNTISANGLDERLDHGGRVFSELEVSGGETSASMGSRAQFKNCVFKEVTFKNKVIDNAFFTECEFVDCKFEDVTLQVCVFQECRLLSSTFLRSSIASCSFRSCWMHTVRLGESKSIVHAEFIDCDLRHTWGLEYDSNYIKGSSLPQTAATLYGYRRRYLSFSFKDRVRHFFGYFLEREFPKWQVLQRHYTVSVMSLYILLTAIAFAPQIARVFFYKSLGAGQAHLAGAESVRGWSESSVAEVFLGFHDGSWPTVTLTVSLLLFNFLRLFVTASVLKLAHNQSLCDTTPYWREYAYLYRIHLILIPLLLLAIATSVWNAYEFLTTPIQMPD